MILQGNSVKNAPAHLRAPAQNVPFCLCDSQCCAASSHKRPGRVRSPEDTECRVQQLLAACHKSFVKARRGCEACIVAHLCFSDSCVVVSGRRQQAVALVRSQLLQDIESDITPVPDLKNNSSCLGRQASSEFSCRARESLSV